MKIPLRKLFPVTSLACEAMSVAALYFSHEIPSFLFAIMGALGGAALLFRISDFWLLPLIAGTVLCGIWAGFKLTIAIGTLVAAPTMVVHALTWLGREQGRYRYWRIGLAFLEMILAAILAPEVHMFFLIFFFVILLSLSLSFGFLEQNFAHRDPAGLNRPLRAAYLSAVLLLSFVIFLSSLAIFPILPRKENLDTGSGGAGAMPGYSEEVSFQTATFYWTGDESKPVMWLFLPQGQNLSWEEMLPHGLLRGKALEHFDGKTWRTGVKSSQVGVGSRSADWQVEILREPMPADALPVPYGTEGLESNVATALPLRLATGEWTQPGGIGRRISYVAKVSRRASTDKVLLDAETEVPNEGFGKLKALGQTLGAKAKTDRARALAVLNFFQNGFTAEQVPVAAAAEKGASPIETFLFETKRGHCELFATATALLLRSMHVPTRLVVGFRAPPGKGMKVLTVRNGDAHAWVEAWIDGQWQVLDPTPAIPLPSSAWQAARDLFDWVTAYWHRYILGYEFNGEAIAKWILVIFLGAAVFALGMRMFHAVVYLLTKPRSGPREEVGLVRGRLEKRWKIAGAEFEFKLQRLPSGTAWFADYERLRFGPKLPESAAVKALSERSQLLLREAAQAAASAPPGR